MCRHTIGSRAEGITLTQSSDGARTFPAARGVKFYYGFSTFWLALASIVPCIILAANVAGALFFIWPVAALWILVAGTKRTRGVGITIDEVHRTLTVDNWFRSVVVSFDAIGKMGRSRVIVGAPRYGGPIYRPSVVQRDGSKVRIGAASGEAAGGDIHSALAQLGGRLGIPVQF